MFPLRSLPPAPREWRGPLSRSRSRGQRSNGRQSFHLHLHGVSAEDIAAILAREAPPGPDGPPRVPKQIVGARSVQTPRAPWAARFPRYGPS